VFDDYYERYRICRQSGRQNASLNFETSQYLLRPAQGVDFGAGRWKLI
jgi:hypothetical protein